MLRLNDAPLAIFIVNYGTLVTMINVLKVLFVKTAKTALFTLRSVTGIACP